MKKLLIISIFLGATSALDAMIIREMGNGLWRADLFEVDGDWEDPLIEEQLAVKRVKFGVAVALASTAVAAYHHADNDLSRYGIAGAFAGLSFAFSNIPLHREGADRVRFIQYATSKALGSMCAFAALVALGGYEDFKINHITT